jgi:four helix bundle protein
MLENKNRTLQYEMSYKKLEIWRLARDLSVDIHKMTLTLPRFEQFEEARQIRKSSKRVRSTIVEGYGRRYYMADYIRFIIYALASNDETSDLLETLFETDSLTDQSVYEDIRNRLDVLGRKLDNFLQSIQDAHLTAENQVKDPHERYASAFFSMPFPAFTEAAEDKPAFSTHGPASSFRYVY